MAFWNSIGAVVGHDSLTYLTDIAELKRLGWRWVRRPRGKATLRVRVNDKLCQGHTLCARSAPAVFKLRDEDGHAYVEEESVPIGQLEAARRAVIGCPEQAIEIIED